MPHAEMRRRMGGINLPLDWLGALDRSGCCGAHGISLLDLMDLYNDYRDNDNVA
jgi:hypothetical protein